MCGRYAASKDQAELVEEFDIELVASEPGRSVLATPQQPPAGTADYNMAPTKQAPVVLARAPRGATAAGAEATPQDPVRQLRLLTWGLVPSWSKHHRGAARMINARVETVRDKPAYRSALATRRCLVPATGWYEWQVSPTATDRRGKPRKQPFFIHRADGATAAFAGLYEFWRDPAVTDRDDPAAWLATFTVITTEAEPGLDRIHDRQPLVLERDDWAEWLDPTLTDPAALSLLVRGYGPGRFAAYPVSTAVNGSLSNGPGLLVPADADQLHGVVDPITGEVIGHD